MNCFRLTQRSINLAIAVATVLALTFGPARALAAPVFSVIPCPVTNICAALPISDGNACLLTYEQLADLYKPTFERISYATLPIFIGKACRVELKKNVSICRKRDELFVDGAKADSRASSAFENFPRIADPAGVRSAYQVRLPSGDYLSFGGKPAAGVTSAPPISTVYWRRSQSAAWTMVPRMMSVGRVHLAACMVTKVTLLITGGFVGNRTTESCEFFDTGADTFKRAPDLQYARQSHTVTPMNQKNAIVVGGDDGLGHCVAACEKFDSELNSFKYIGELNESRTGHCAARLSDGSLLITGGIHLEEGGEIHSNAQSIELFKGE